MKHKSNQTIRAVAISATLLRSWVVTLWSFWQNVSQLEIYGSQANTLIDNAGVIQVFGARNQRVAQDFANPVGSVAAEDIPKMANDDEILLIEGKPVRCKQARYHGDPHFEAGRV